MATGAQLSKEERAVFKDATDKYLQAREHILSKWHGSGYKEVLTLEACQADADASLAEVLPRAFAFLAEHGLVNWGALAPRPPPEEPKEEAEEKLSKAKLVTRLYEILRTVDFNVTTEKMIRKQLEGDLGGVDLSEHKGLIRDHVMHVVNNMDTRDTLEPLPIDGDGDEGKGKKEAPAPVVVLGAGPAGLAAASLLKANGVEVVVVDASDAPGGHAAAPSAAAAAGLSSSAPGPAQLLPVEPTSALHVLCAQLGRPPTERAAPAAPGVRLYDGAGTPVDAAALTELQGVLGPVLEAAAASAAPSLAAALAGALKPHLPRPPAKAPAPAAAPAAAVEAAPAPAAQVKAEGGAEAKAKEGSGAKAEGEAAAADSAAPAAEAGEGGEAAAAKPEEAAGGGEAAAATATATVKAEAGALDKHGPGAAAANGGAPAAAEQGRLSAAAGRLAQLLMAALELQAGAPLASLSPAHLRALLASPSPLLAALLPAPPAAPPSPLQALPCSVGELCAEWAAAQGLELRLSQGASRLAYSSSSVSLDTTGLAQALAASAVVLALPAAALAAATATEGAGGGAGAGAGRWWDGASLELSPAAPAWKAEALARLPAGALVEVTLTFDSAFWPSPCSSAASVFAACPPLAAPGGAGEAAPAPSAAATAAAAAAARGMFSVWLAGADGSTLVGLASGEAGIKAHAMGDDDLRREALAALRAGPFPDAPEPSAPGSVARWATAAPPPPVGMEAQLLAQPYKRLAFAGDFTLAAGGAVSALAAAVASGVREGARVLKMLRGDESLAVGDEEPLSSSQLKATTAKHKAGAAVKEEEKAGKGGKTKDKQEKQFHKASKDKEKHKGGKDKDGSHHHHHHHKKDKRRRDDSGSEEEDDEGDDRHAKKKKKDKDKDKEKRKRRREAAHGGGGSDSDGGGGDEPHEATRRSTRERGGIDLERPRYEMDGARAEAAIARTKAYHRAVLQAGSSGTLALLREQMAACSGLTGGESLSGRDAMLKALLIADRRAVEAMAKESWFLRNLADWLAELLEEASAEHMCVAILKVLQAMVRGCAVNEVSEQAKRQASGPPRLRPDTLQSVGLTPLLTGRCTTHRGKEVRSLAAAILSAVGGSGGAAGTGSSNGAAAAGAAGGRPAAAGAPASVAPLSIAVAARLAAPAARQLLSLPGRAPPPPAAGAAGSTAAGTRPASAQGGHAANGSGAGSSALSQQAQAQAPLPPVADEATRAKLAALEAAAAAARQEAAEAGARRVEVATMAPLAAALPAVATFDEFRRAEKGGGGGGGGSGGGAALSGRLGAHEGRKGGAPSSSGASGGGGPGSASGSAQVTPAAGSFAEKVTNYVKQLLKQAIAEKRMDGRSYEDIKKKAVAKVLDGGESGELDSKRKDKVRGLVEAYVARAKPGSSGR